MNESRAAAIAQAVQQLDTIVPSKFDVYFLDALASRFVNYDVFAGDDLRFPVTLAVTIPPGLHVAEVVAQLESLFPTSGTEFYCAEHLTGWTGKTFAFLTALAAPHTLMALTKASWVTEINWAANSMPNRAVPRLRQPNVLNAARQRPQPSANDVLVAIIDHGCPFAHEAFLEAGNTRVHAIWDQDDRPDFPSAAGTVPEGFGYGRQVFASAMNQFIAASRHAGRVDEDQCYRIAEYSAMDSRLTHGAFALGLLAGNWQSPSLIGSKHLQPARSKLNLRPDIVFVQLPRSVPIAPGRGNIERFTMDGIRYALMCAKDHSKLVVVVDYGTEMGPHDGTSWFERSLDDAVVQAQVLRGIVLKVCFASGNAHQAKRKAVVFPHTENSGELAELLWWAPPGNDSPCFVEVWFNQDQANASFQLFAPGQSTPTFNLNLAVDATAVSASGDTLRCTAVCQAVGDQRQLLVRIQPTSQPDAQAGYAQPGAWRMTFKAAPGLPAGPFHAYAAWGGHNPGLPQRVWPGRWFVPTRFKTLVDSDGSGTIIGSACGSQSVAVGGFEIWGDGERAEYSSAGPGRKGRVVDFLAVTEESPALAGLLCLGTRSGSTARARGTSFAAPQLARKLATTGIPPAKAPVPKRSPLKLRPSRPEYGEKRVVP